MTIHDMSALELELKELVADIIEIGPEEITKNADFVNDLGMDSMQALEILAAVEKQYSIQMPEEYLGKITTFSELFELTKESLR